MIGTLALYTFGTARSGLGGIIGVNLAGILGGRRDGSRIGWCNEWVPPGQGKAPPQKKLNLSLEMACFVGL